MSEHTDHWTRDSDLLERYVLGRLESREKQLLEQHLRQCDICRKAVDSEKTLILGIKRYGREEMKRRLSERVRTTRPIRVPWPHIVSAAAVVMIVLGLGIYNRWWWTDIPTIQSEEEISDVAVSKKEANEGLKQESVEIRSIPPSGDVDSRLETVVEPPAAASGAGRRDRTVPKKGTDDLKQKKSVPAEAPERMEMNEAMEDREGERMSQVWVEGIILPQAFGKSTLPKAAARARAETDAVSADEFRSSLDQRQIAVIRKPAGEIPKTQQMMQRRGTVVTSVEQSQNRLNLVIYSDEVDLDEQNVQVDSMGRDSLIVTINGLQIAYRIPQGWLQPAIRAK